MYTQSTEALFSTNNSFHSNELLICAAKGYIFALQKSNGHIIWKLQIGSSSCTISLFIADNDTIIAGTSNKTHSIDLITGKTNWINKLHGVEEEEITVLSTPSPQSFKTEELDLPPPPYERKNPENTPFIFTFSKGLVTAIHAKSGITQWKYSIPLNAQQLPVAIIDPPSKLTNLSSVFIGISRTVYSIDASSGKLNWITQLSYIPTGSKSITLASS